MGFEKAFNYHCPADIFREHAALSAYKNDNDRLFNISALADISNQQYDELTPMQWPIINKREESSIRVLEDGQFYTEDKKAHFIAITPSAPKNSVNEAYPFVLNTGRVRDHWHTMTRTGMSPRLSAHTIESYVEIPASFHYQHYGRVSYEHDLTSLEGHVSPLIHNANNPCLWNATNNWKIVILVFSE